uniref:ATP synthase F0 subunit 8 n=1 Tax=Doriprismatica atromarginata TaxID=154629 RepID=A0A895KXQ5_DORAT|nr:ATP synthase F0 subunit 8 [Doriprismatica atromarginata]QRZ60631.1 ATP synthase F0 subunit 8 [Doriprismatica atromarginata]
MPQLSPMLAFFMFAIVLAAYIILFSSLSKKDPFVFSTKLSKSSKKSFTFFK